MRRNRYTPRPRRHRRSAYHRTARYRPEWSALAIATFASLFFCFPLVAILAIPAWAETAGGRKRGRELVVAALLILGAVVVLVAMLMLPGILLPTSFAP